MTLSSIHLASLGRTSGYMCASSYVYQSFCMKHDTYRKVMTFVQVGERLIDVPLGNLLSKLKIDRRCRPELELQLATSISCSYVDSM